MRVIKRVVLFCAIFFVVIAALAVRYGVYFSGTEEEAMTVADKIFTEYIDHHKLSRELFLGPTRLDISKDGLVFEWVLKPLEPHYINAKIRAFVAGAFNSGPTIDLETLTFFKEECKREKTRENSINRFSGFC
jgi:hypothetical protein